MGTVRREGDWRLEKCGEGTYEITFQKETQLKVFTSDAPQRANAGLGFEPTPVREVSSYSEAEGLFEEKAHGSPPIGMQSSSNWGGSNQSSHGEDLDLSELPPSGIGFVLLLTGGFVIFTFLDTNNSLILLIGGAMVLGGLTPFVYAGYLFRSEGWRPAWDFLIENRERNDSDSSGDDDVEKTPPAPKNIKNILIFDRANQECEWCEEQYDHLQVHHIEPRREGGPNEPDNLIVLCPNCHENADREAIPRSKLRAKVDRLPSVQINQ